MIRSILFLVLSIPVSIAAAMAQERLAPAISESFPPAQDVRRPDRTIRSPGNAPVHLIRYNNNGRLLVSADGDHVIRLWESRPGQTGTGELVRAFEGHTERVIALGLGAETNTLLSFSEDQTVKVWDLESGLLRRSHEIAVGTNVDVAVFRPGSEPWLAVGSSNQLALWNFASGEVVKSFPPQPARITAIVFDADGGRMIGGTEDGTIRRWELPRGILRSEVQIGSPAQALATSSNHVVFGSDDGIVRLIRYPTLEQRPLKGLTGRVLAVAFSPRGEQVAATGADGSVKVWDVETGALLCSQEGHTGDVESVAFSPNGQKLASSGADGTIRYWTVPLPPIPTNDLAKIKAALPSAPTVKPKKPRRLLVFWRADAILHKGGVPAANHAIELMGQATGAYEADFSRDYEVFDPAVLSKYDAIVMNSTAHLSMPEGAKRAYLDFARRGGGVVGIHAAMDTFRDWPEGAAVIGATFGNHPWGPSGTWAVKVEEPEHPLVRAFDGKGFKIRDEFYEMWDPYTRADRRVLLSVDLSDETTANVRGLRRTDRDFALSWVKRYGEGRVFYCVFGHIGEPFQRAEVLRYYLDGIQYALGDLAVDDSPR